MKKYFFKEIIEIQYKNIQALSYTILSISYYLDFKTYLYKNYSISFYFLLYCCFGLGNRKGKKVFEYFLFLLYWCQISVFCKMLKNSGSLLHTGNDLFELEPLLHVFFLFVHFLVVTSWDWFVLRQGDLFLLRNAHVLIRRLKQLLLWPQSLHWEEFGLWSFGTWTHIWV